MDSNEIDTATHSVTLRADLIERGMAEYGAISVPDMIRMAAEDGIRKREAELTPSDIETATEHGVGAALTEYLLTNGDLEITLPEEVVEPTGDGKVAIRFVEDDQ